MSTKVFNDSKEAWRTNMQDEIVSLALYTVYLALAMFFGMMFKSFIFGYLGENVTMVVRQLLYRSILEKHIGFFDHQENQSSVLTSAMA